MQVTTRPNREAPIEVANHPWYNTRHHERRGFRNIWGAEPHPFMLKAAAWMITRRSVAGRSRPTPFRLIEAEELRAPVKTCRAFWIGHSTVYLRTARRAVITDPVFSPRVSPVSFAGPERLTPLPLGIEDLPGVDVVLLSHNHYDHLDEASLSEINRRFAPVYFVPRGNGNHMRALGIERVVELDWWQYADFEELRVHCAPAKHFSGRGVTDRDRTLWTSLFLEDREGGAKIYFAGDTAYADFFKEVRERLGAPDLALMPIGAYRPRWMMRRVHVNPAEAVRAFLDLEARQMLGIHWGTFELSDELLHEPAELTLRIAREKGLDEGRMGIVPVGGYVDL